MTEIYTKGIIINLWALVLYNMKKKYLQRNMLVELDLNSLKVLYNIGKYLLKEDN